MPLQIKYSIDAYGETLVFEEAYLKIVQLYGNEELLQFDYAIYKDSSKQTQIDYKMGQFVPSVEEDSPNFIKQIYEYLKTLEEFADAIDVLEENLTPLIE
ncbi:hypothetical protein [Niallia nealsonii]|uniref:Uncharacterized protein n=1 Tax=Niallia nealsonii TaxID=115979 RepID=A0A2N0Z366_9BACI|nr:hypothetical protein [Niallia nealsonii]PKG23952.1 hypothetical protein CWS01_09290 [Niallia nealsonii]